jgi:hypothetical protein
MPQSNDSASLASFSLSALLESSRLDAAAAIERGAIAALGEDAWRQGRDALARAMADAAKIGFQLARRSLDVGEEAKQELIELKAQADKARAAQALASSSAPAASGRSAASAISRLTARPAILLDDFDPATAGPAPLLQRRAALLRTLAGHSSAHFAVAFGRLGAADRQAAVAALLAAADAAASPEAAEALSRAVFEPLSPAEALLPLSGQAAVAEPAVATGSVALRVGLAVGVLRAQSSPAAQAKLAEDRRFGFEPAADADSGSFEHHSGSFLVAEPTEFALDLPKGVLGAHAARAMAAAFGASAERLLLAAKTLSLNGEVFAEGDRAHVEPRLAMPEGFAERSAALLNSSLGDQGPVFEAPDLDRPPASAADSSASLSLDAIFLIDPAPSKAKRRGWTPLSTIASVLAELDESAGAPIAPELLSAAEPRGALPEPLARRVAAAEAMTRSHSLAKLGVLPVSVAAEALAPSRALVEETFAIAGALRETALGTPNSFWEARVAASAASARQSVPGRQDAWLRQNGAISSVELAREAFGDKPTVAQTARVSRAPAAFAQALRECGVAGLMAVALVDALGLAPSGIESGNALCAHARDAWVGRGGSAAGWKLLGQLSAEQVEPFLRAARDMSNAKTNASSASTVVALGRQNLDAVLALANACAAAQAGPAALAFALAVRAEASRSSHRLSPVSAVQGHQDALEAELPAAQRPGEAALALTLRDRAALLRAPLFASDIAPARGAPLPESMPARDISAIFSSLLGPSDPLLYLQDAQRRGLDQDGMSAAVGALLPLQEERQKVLRERLRARLAFAQEETAAQAAKAPFALRDLLVRVQRAAEADFAATAAAAAQATPNAQGETPEDPGAFVVAVRPADAQPRRANETNAERLAREVVEVADWLRASEPGVWIQMQDKPQWPTLARRAREWHDLVAQRENAERGKNAWKPLIGEQADGPLLARELTDGQMLHEEGKAMHHCVSTYAAKCAQGRARILSIRLDGERHSTLELGFEHGVWVVAQHRGLCNTAKIDPRAIELGRKLADMANELALRPEAADPAEPAGAGESEQERAARERQENIEQDDAINEMLLLDPRFANLQRQLRGLAPNVQLNMAAPAEREPAGPENPPILEQLMRQRAARAAQPPEAMPPDPAAPPRAQP